MTIPYTGSLSAIVSQKNLSLREKEIVENQKFLRRTRKSFVKCMFTSNVSKVCQVEA